MVKWAGDVVGAVVKGYDNGGGVGGCMLGKGDRGRDREVFTPQTG